MLRFRRTSTHSLYYAHAIATRPTTAPTTMPAIMAPGVREDEAELVGAWGLGEVSGSPVSSEGGGFGAGPGVPVAGAR